MQHERGQLQNGDTPLTQMTPRIPAGRGLSRRARKEESERERDPLHQENHRQLGLKSFYLLFLLSFDQLRSSPASRVS